MFLAFRILFPSAQFLLGLVYEAKKNIKAPPTPSVGYKSGDIPPSSAASEKSQHHSSMHLTTARFSPELGNYQPQIEKSGNVEYGFQKGQQQEPREPQTPAQPNKGSGNCYNCGKPGHLARNCWKKLGELKLDSGAKLRGVEEPSVDGSYKSKPKRSRKKKTGKEGGQDSQDSPAPTQKTEQGVSAIRKGEDKTKHTRDPLVPAQKTEQSLSTIRKEEKPTIDADRKPKPKRWKKKTQKSPLAVVVETYSDTESSGGVTLGPVDHDVEDYIPGAVVAADSFFVTAMDPDDPRATLPVPERNVVPVDPKHAHLSWTVCYDDDCPIHLSDKNGSGWFPSGPVETKRGSNTIENRVTSAAFPAERIAVTAIEPRANLPVRRPNFPAVNRDPAVNREWGHAGMH